MCNPALIVTGLMTAYGTYTDSEAQKTNAEYQEDISAMNAKVEDKKAVDAAERGAESLQDHMQRVARLKGAQRANMASRGLDLSSGSSLNVLNDTDYFGNEDARRITENAGREGWAYGANAANYRSQANMYGAKADNINPGLDAGISLLGSWGGSVSDKWGSWKSSKPANSSIIPGTN